MILSLFSNLSSFFLVLAQLASAPAELPVKEIVAAAPVVETVVSVESYIEKAAELHDALSLEQYGLEEEVLELALKGHEKLAMQNEIPNDQVLTIVDFSQPSSKKRLYVLDLENEKLLQNTWVSHGRNSGYEMATKFSNVMESHQSSLGFYLTANTYYGGHGLSLRMEGLEKGFNDKAMSRAIVVHGADYIGPHRAGGFQGRSFGCPAVPAKESKQLINTIKDGSLMFIYHPSKKYLNGSKLLNG